jgi:hypothetical protein
MRWSGLAAMVDSARFDLGYAAHSLARARWFTARRRADFRAWHRRQRGGVHGGRPRALSLRLTAVTHNTLELFGVDVLRAEISGPRTPPPRRASR